MRDNKAEIYHFPICNSKSISVEIEGYEQNYGIPILAMPMMSDEVWEQLTAKCGTSSHA